MTVPTTLCTTHHKLVWPNHRVFWLL